MNSVVLTHKMLDVPMAFRTPSVDALLSWRGNVFNTRRITSHGRSLTLDGLEGLSTDSSILFLEEAIKPLTCYVNILDSEKVRYKFDCVAVSKVPYK